MKALKIIIKHTIRALKNEKKHKPIYIGGNLQNTPKDATVAIWDGLESEWHEIQSACDAKVKR